MFCQELSKTWVRGLRILSCHSDQGIVVVAHKFKLLNACGSESFLTDGI